VRIVQRSIGLLALFCVALGLGTWWLRRPHAPARPPAAGHEAPVQSKLRLEPTAEPDDRTLFLRRMNLAKAYLETAEYDEAIKTLAAVLSCNPDCMEAQRNLARAHLLTGDAKTALELLTKLAETRPASATTSYLSGAALVRLLRLEEAIPYCEQAVQLDPNTAAVRFQLATAYKGAGLTDKAREQLLETVRLDPAHQAALYQLAMLARKEGQTEKAQSFLRDFMRLRKIFGKQAASANDLIMCAHTNAEPPAVDQAANSAPPADIAVRFSDQTDQVFGPSSARSAAALAIVDMDEQGRYTLLALDPEGGLSLLILGPLGGFNRTPIQPKLPGLGDITDMVVGNFYDQPATDNSEEDSISGLYADVFVLSENGARLLMRTGRDTLEDVTESAGLAGVSGRQARWVDYEYDGDLDLLIGRETGLQLWQNNGNGTFSQVTAEVGIANTAQCVDIEAFDFDSNNAVDLIVAQGDLPTLVFQNQRTGRLAPMPEPPGPWPPARQVLANDVNNDGHPDALLVGAHHAEIILGQVALRARIEMADFRPETAILLDYDNNGWLDLCAAGTSQAQPAHSVVRLWRNGGAGAWTEVTADCGLDNIELPPIRDLVSADLDADGDTDLLLRTADGKMRFLRNEGGHVRGQLKVRLFSLQAANHGGIGTQIEIRAGEYCVTRWVQRELPVEIGLNGRTKLDTVRTVWTDGVVHTKTMVEATGQPLDFVITEFVSTGSCPYLYVWDGRDFRFVTDLLGGGALGVPISRAELEPVNPYEMVVIGTSERFLPRAGHYTLKITNEQRETDYLDFFELIAVDHPPRVEIHSADKLGSVTKSNGLPSLPQTGARTAAAAARRSASSPSQNLDLSPLIRSDPRALVRLIAPVKAEGDDHLDRTAALSAIDGRFAAPGQALPPPLRGICRPLALTLDFGPLPTDRPLVLALTGWLQYGTSSSNIALSQNRSVETIPPVLEVETDAGVWTTLDVQVGLPAGKTKTILCDLNNRLPPGAKRLRLTTTCQVRWDRIALAQYQEVDMTRVQRLRFEGAQLEWRGFSEISSRAEGHPSTPDYGKVSAQPPWYTAVKGWYTRYGDVTSLLARPDGKLTLLNGGDMLTLQADATKLTPIPAGMVRTFLLSSVGWNKEGDPNTVGGDQVAPLPGNAHAASVSVPEDEDGWRRRYNTRQVAPDHFHPRRTE
jgi:tetratricopeptide (TPR) repeat protein